MPLNHIARTQLFNMIKSNFRTEINYFAQNNVMATTHIVGVASLESWTHYMLEAGIIRQRPTSADRFIELERTMTSLYCLLVMAQNNGVAYNAYIDAQHNSEITADEILTKARFDILHERCTQLTSSRKTFIIIFNLILLSDIFKSQAARTIIRNNHWEIDTEQGSDDMMAEVLQLPEEKIFKVLPSFNLLEHDVRQAIKQIYPIMQTCMGHIHFLESGEKAFNRIAVALTGIPTAKRKHYLQIAFMAQFLDAAGSHGQQRISGAYASTMSFTISYDLVYAKLMALESELNINNISRISKKIFVEYLSERSALLGLVENARETPFLTRLGAMLRGTTAQVGTLLMQEFILLNTAVQRILVEELSFEGAQIEKWNNVTYLATVILNQSRKAIAQQQLQEAVSDAMDAAVCLALLIKHIAKEHNRQGELTQTKRLISFREFASLGGTEPNQLNPKYFNANDFHLNPDTFKVEKKPAPIPMSASPALFKPGIYRSIRLVAEEHDASFSFHP